MNLENEFTVDAPVEEAWAALLDVERVAPCLPGAAITGSDNENYTGTMTVKIGPVTQKFNGTVHYEEADEQNRRAVLKADGKESRGQGMASATITSTLHSENGSTKVRVDTDMSLTGKVAQFGQGMQQDVASRIMDQFATCLEKEITGEDAREESATEEQPHTRRIDQPEPEPLDLGAASYEAVLKRAAPVAAGAGVLAAAIWFLRRRRTTYSRLQ
jgi:carbon monoxide dehydrogenase subunit G